MRSRSAGLGAGPDAATASASGNPVVFRANGERYEPAALPAVDVARILERAEELGPDWPALAREIQYSPRGTFFVYRRDGGDRIADVRGLDELSVAPLLEALTACSRPHRPR